MDSTAPTVNLLRKMFHTSLMKLTADHQKLKELMMRLDGNSPATQQRHYCLRDPEDDVQLAQVLVHTVLGEPCTYPSGDQLQHHKISFTE
eukprot:380864-Amphidinium_carterae.1